MPPECDYRTVRLAADLVKRAKHVCSHRRITMAEYLTPLLRAQVEADYEVVIEAQHHALRQKNQDK
jgi:hypothetical protein